MNDYIDELINSLQRVDLPSVQAVAQVLSDPLGIIYVMGNGGSAAIASHFAADLQLHSQAKSRIRSICLNDNISALTASSNDVSYDRCFVESLAGLRRTDKLVCFSVSGTSSNILNAIDYANSVGAITIGISSGDLLNKVDYPIYVRADRYTYEICEDVFSTIAHLLTIMT